MYLWILQVSLMDPSSVSEKCNFFALLKGVVYLSSSASNMLQGVPTRMPGRAMAWYSPEDLKLVCLVGTSANMKIRHTSCKEATRNV